MEVIAPVNPPSYQQADSYPARIDRLTLAGLLTPQYAVGPLVGRNGVKPYPPGSGYGMQVSAQATPNMSVSVSAGTLWIAAVSAIGGSYECANDGPYTVPIAASHPTLSRIDMIIARVYDAVDNSGDTQSLWTLEPVTGTPALSPAIPPMPSLQCHNLTEVLVPAAASTIVTGDLTPLAWRNVAVGGVLPVRGSLDLPVSPYAGQVVWREDSGTLQIYNGTAWVTVPAANPTGYATPSMGSGWATGPAGGSYMPIKCKIGGTGNLEIAGAFHSTTTTPGATAFTLPPGMQPVEGHRIGVATTEGATPDANIVSIAAGTGVATLNRNFSAANVDCYVYVGNIPMT